MTRIALTGLGEVGSVLAEDLAGHVIAAWDIQFPDPQSKPSANLRRLQIAAGKNAATAVDGAELVISAVTAAQTVEAAHAAAAALAPGAFFLDLNSASPEAKIAAARLVDAAGGRYVEAAVMSPIAPKRLQTAMLLGGRHVSDFLPLARALGFFGATPLSETLGMASAAKLCRSVIVKGVEALLTESLYAARHYGVERTVLDSLQDLFPRPDWPEHAGYMISRAVAHGVRRAEEMREAAKTVSLSGLLPELSVAIADRQEWAAGAGAARLTELVSALRSMGKG